MDQSPALMMVINVCCGQGLTGVLNMTQGLFRELLLRLEPAFRHPESSAYYESMKRNQKIKPIYECRCEALPYVTESFKRCEKGVPGGVCEKKMEQQYQ